MADVPEECEDGEDPDRAGGELPQDLGPGAGAGLWAQPRVGGPHT